MLQTATFLDQMVERFRHRWETNPQYRAAFSGVVGLVVLVALCSCAGIVSSVTNRVLANTGFSSSNAVGPLSGSGPILQGASHFPTETVPAWQAGQIPAGPPIPNSGTPYPSPTKPPTPTVQPSPTGFPGGGGGGGGQTPACSGSNKNGSLTWALSPCPVPAGSTLTLTITAPNLNGQSPNILFSLGACPSTVTCFWDYTPGQFTVSGGQIVLTFAVPIQAAHNPVNITGSVSFSSGPSVSITGPPVQ
jgi:hypothetical protein